MYNVVADVLDVLKTFIITLRISIKESPDKLLRL